MSRKPRNEYVPDSVSPPGETLKDMLEERGMTQTALAARSGHTPKLINEIINGKAPITPETALQLERVLGMPAAFWNERERHYREALARGEEATVLQQAEALEWLRRFPLKAMTTLGWLPESKSRVEQLRALLTYLGVASPDAWDAWWTSRQVCFRMSPSFKPDRHALAAWLRMGELVAQRTECKPYDASAFRRALREIRSLTVEEPRVFQPRIVELCAASGVAMVFTPELPNIRSSGAARWLKADKALIQVNLRHKSNDHFWFTVFHEAGHILNDSKKEVFVDCNDFKGDHEEAANDFAAEMLVPRRELDKFLNAAPLLLDREIEAFAEKIGIAPGIVVGQLQHRGALDYNRGNRLKRKFTWSR